MKQFNDMDTKSLGFERKNEDRSKKVGLLIINLQKIKKLSFLNDDIYFDRSKYGNHCLLTFHHNFLHQRKNRRKIISMI